MAAAIEPPLIRSSICSLRLPNRRIDTVGPDRASGGMVSGAIRVATMLSIKVSALSRRNRRAMAVEPRMGGAQAIKHFVPRFVGRPGVRLSGLCDRAEVGFDFLEHGVGLIEIGHVGLVNPTLAAGGLD